MEVEATSRYRLKNARAVARVEGRTARVAAENKAFASRIVGWCAGRMDRVVRVECSPTLLAWVAAGLCGGDESAAVEMIRLAVGDTP